MTVSVVAKPKAAAPQHVCALPGWRARRLLGVDLWSIVKCDECGGRFQWLKRGRLEGATWVPIR